MCQTNTLDFLQWEEQHVGLSCEEFAQWKKDNDPELQAQGLADYLQEEGIGKNYKMFCICSKLIIGY